MTTNRRQRRRDAERDCSARKIRQLQHRVEFTGKPGVIYGLIEACRDCHATGELVLLPGRRAISHVYQDDRRTALPGVTWQPCWGEICSP